MGMSYDPHDDAPTETVQKSATQARQGLLGRPVLIVLVSALILALVAWAGAEFYGEAIDATAPSTTTEQNSGAKPATPGTGESAPAAGQDTITNSPTDRDPTPETGTGGDSQSTAPNGVQDN